MDDGNSQGWTALHWAVDEDIDGALQMNEPVTLNTARALIEAGADETAQNNEGLTPRDVAAAYGEKALRLYDAISLIDWSGEPSLREFTNQCRDILSSCGYDVRLLDDTQMSIARDSSSHSKPFGRVIIHAGHCYSWRRDPGFAVRLEKATNEGLENIERKQASKQ